jgi:hypothetical protein
MRLTVGISIVLITTASEADTPSFIATHPGQTEVAVFEFSSGPKQGKQEGYAIGCDGLGRLWGRVQRPNLTIGQFSSIPVVADIHCDSRTQVFGLGTALPNQYVIRHRDGVTRRHAISHPMFVHVTGRTGGEPISEAELFRRFPEAGTPFNTKIEDFCIRQVSKTEAYPTEYQVYVEGNISRFGCGANGPRTSADHIEVYWKFKGEDTPRTKVCNNTEICVYDERWNPVWGDKTITCVAITATVADLTKRISTTGACGQAY